MEIETIRALFQSPQNAACETRKADCDWRANFDVMRGATQDYLRQLTPLLLVYRYRVDAGIRDATDSSRPKTLSLSIPISLRGGRYSRIEIRLSKVEHTW